MALSTLMDAWESLLSGATIPTGDAWELLEARGGGGGGEATYLVLAEGLEVDMNTQDVVIYMEPTLEIDVEVDLQDLLVEIEISHTVEV